MIPERVYHQNIQYSMEVFTRIQDLINLNSEYSNFLSETVELLLGVIKQMSEINSKIKKVDNDIEEHLLVKEYLSKFDLVIYTESLVNDLIKHLK